ncbi:MAG: hypothetical protein Sapg2KO_16910 [Saprospiraceae bacterium]
MQTFLRALKVFILFALLSFLTQVGGLIYLIYQPLSYFLRKKIPKNWSSMTWRLFSFSLLYLVCTLFIIPPLAQRHNRVPLPWFATKKTPIKAHNPLFSALLNRHYVRPELKAIFIEKAKNIQGDIPNLQLTYLDANFPFWNNFPLLPHLSHDDGQKLDISFIYQKSNRYRAGSPTILGYGYCESPKKGETDMPAICTQKGEWQYSALQKITRQQSNWAFTVAPNKALLKAFATDSRIGKIFIEKHLEERLGLSAYTKIRQAGCHSVRHDDHIHIQL